MLDSYNCFEWTWWLKSTNKTEQANTESKTCFSFTGSCDQPTHVGEGKAVKKQSGSVGGCEYVCSTSNRTKAAEVMMQIVQATDSGCWCLKKKKKLHNTYIFINDIR